MMIYLQQETHPRITHFFDTNALKIPVYKKWALGSQYTSNQTLSQINSPVFGVISLLPVTIQIENVRYPDILSLMRLPTHKHLKRRHWYPCEHDNHGGPGPHPTIRHRKSFYY